MSKSHTVHLKTPQKVSHNLASSAAWAPSVRRDTCPFLQSWTLSHNSQSDSDVSPQSLASIRLASERGGEVKLR